MTLTEILDNKHELTLEWLECWSSDDSEYNDVGANITLRASVNDCLNLERRKRRVIGAPIAENITLLGDFMTIHWATVVKEKVNDV